MAMNVNEGWYNQNETRRFPFADEAAVVSTDGNVTIPDAFMVDLIISSPLNIDPSAFYVSNIKGYGGGVVITFAVGSVDVATATVSSSHQRYASYAVTPLTSDNIIGRVVLGTADAVAAMSVYNANFALSSTRIATSCVRPRIAGVDSLTVKTADGREFRLTGQVTLVAGENTSISVNGATLKVNVAGGVVYDNRFGCNTDLSGRVPVMSINGVLPDNSGNIDLVGTNCVAVTPGDHGVTISDTCSKPCCGCEELDAIKTGEDSLKSSLNSVLSFLIGLESKVNSLESSFNRSGIPV